MEWTGPARPGKANGLTLSSTPSQGIKNKDTVKQPPEDPRTSETSWMHLKREPEAIHLRSIAMRKLGERGEGRQREEGGKTSDGERRKDGGRSE